jgi:hypothetical protein
MAILAVQYHHTERTNILMNGNGMWTHTWRNEWDWRKRFELNIMEWIEDWNEKQKNGWNTTWRLFWSTLFASLINLGLNMIYSLGTQYVIILHLIVIWLKFNLNCNPFHNPTIFLNYKKKSLNS